MGPVKTGLPLTPITVPAHSGMRELHLAMMAASGMDSALSALPTRETASWRTRPVSYRDVSDPLKRVCGVGGSGRPA